MYIAIGKMVNLSILNVLEVVIVDLKVAVENFCRLIIRVFVQFFTYQVA